MHDEEADDYTPPNNSPVFMDVSTPNDMATPTADLWKLERQYTAATDDALKFDITAPLEYGFNSIRVHQKVNPERYYYQE